MPSCFATGALLISHKMAKWIPTDFPCTNNSCYRYLLSISRQSATHNIPPLNPRFQQPVMENLDRSLLQRAGAADEPVAVRAFDFDIEKPCQARVFGVG